MLREFLTALCKDLISSMSGLASIILSFWVTWFPPSLSELRILLWISVFICLLIAAYRTWLTERKKVLAQTDPLFAMRLQQTREHWKQLTTAEKHLVRWLAIQGQHDNPLVNQLYLALWAKRGNMPETAIVNVVRTVFIADYSIRPEFERTVEQVIREDKSVVWQPMPSKAGLK